MARPSLEKISIVGLGKIGICLAACFARQGFEVIGVDISKEVVDAINKGKAPLYEPGLQELITTIKERLKVTTDYKEAILKSEVTFLILPTPSRGDGHFSNKYLKSALKKLSICLKNSKKEYHLFVITSTVSPGSINEDLIPLIEKFSQRRLNKGFGICYNPEFIALGNVIKDLLNPDLVLIGESDRYAGDKLEKIYKKFCENYPYIARMSIISAEITKLSLNAYVTMKISFANTLANICEKIPEADLDAITKALGADRRISPYYLKGGLAYGGPCFPRDNRAFMAFSKKYGCEAKLSKATDEVNQQQINLIKKLVIKHIPEDKKISILGLAYKLNTPVIEESAAVKLIEELLPYNVEITVYDSLAMDNAKRVFKNSIKYAPSIQDCLSSSSCWIFTLPDEEFKKIDHRFVVHNLTTIIDCWRILNPEKLGSKVKYIQLGKAL